MKESINFCNIKCSNFWWKRNYLLWKAPKLFSFGAHCCAKNSQKEFQYVHIWVLCGKQIYCFCSEPKLNIDTFIQDTIPHFFLWLLLSFTDIHFPSFNINGILSGKTQQHGSNRITIENENELRHHKGFLLQNISAKCYAVAKNKWIIILLSRPSSPDKTCYRLRNSKI